MGGAEIKLEAVTVVLRGHFNPAIFHPRWFSAQRLLSEDAAALAEAGLQIVHGQIASFSFNNIELQVTQDLFVVGSTDAATHEVMRDLVVGTFSVLKHTPLLMMGLNTAAHIRPRSEATWNDFGHMLAPKDFWQDYLKEPGTRSLTIEGVRPDEHHGYVRVKVEPSAQIVPGVFVEVNDHYQVGPGEPKEENEPGVGWTMFSTVLANEWEASRSRATALIEHVRAEL
jgi:hypothetical protein